MSYCARDVMITDIIAVGPEMSLGDLESKFLSERISGAPVIKDGKLVGVISRSDIVRQISIEDSYAESLFSDFYQTASLESSSPEPAETTAIAQQVGERMETLKVKDAMIHRVITASPSTSIQVLSQEMVKRNIHRILITDGEKLVGLVAASDLIQLIAEAKLK